MILQGTHLGTINQYLGTDPVHSRTSSFMHLFAWYSQSHKYLPLCPRCDNYTCTPIIIQACPFISASPLEVVCLVFGSRTAPDHRPRRLNESPGLFANSRILQLNWWHPKFTPIEWKRSAHDTIPCKVDQSCSSLAMRNSQDISIPQLMRSSQGWMTMDVPILRICLWVIDGRCPCISPPTHRRPLGCLGLL